MSGSLAMPLPHAAIHACRLARIVVLTLWLAGSTAAAAKSDDESATTAQLVQRAVEAFARPDADMATAEQLLRDALRRVDLTAADKARALFYLGGALGRQEKYAEAITTQDEWLRTNANDGSRHYVLLFQGIYHRALGHEEQALALWRTIVREAPDSDLAAHANQYLGGSIATPGASGPAAVDPISITRHIPAVQAAGGYVVVTIDLDPNCATDVGFLEVATDVARAHHAAIVATSRSALVALIESWRGAPPHQVLFVMRPDTLDVDLHRHVLLASASLDEDVFPDFAFGYFTARTANALSMLWQRTKTTLAEGLAHGPWLSAFVTGAKSAEYDAYLPELASAAGFQGRGYGSGVREHDPECLAFAKQSLAKLKGAAVIEFSGNGDPQGIWLFDDHRNVDASKHWPFSPDQVGHDPEQQMPRVMAQDIAALDLGRPIVWSGTCHSAATHRVFVEADIVSTFGVTSGTTRYDLAAGESLCLAMLDAGAVAYLAPIAANHGYSLLDETEFALRYGASLGDTIKSTYDDVYLAAGGDLHLELHDVPSSVAEPIMQGAGANRILIGDPALAPFTPTTHPSETSTVKHALDGAIEVEVTWAKGFHPRAWDIYGTHRDRDWRIHARVPLDDLLGEGKTTLTTSVTVCDAAGAALPYLLTHAEPETDHGHRYLHLQANANRTAVSDRAVRAMFRVQVE